MFSLKIATFVVAAAALVSSVAAQYTIEPDSVSSSDREAWCLQQITQCPLICADINGGPATVNTCDPDSLTYGCLCSDNVRPNVSEYSLTLPYFVCTEWGNQCVEGCGSNSACASACREDNVCGAKDPTPANTTSTSSTSASATGDSTSTDSVSFDGLAGEDGSPSSNGSAAAQLSALGGAYGVAVIAGSMFAGFALLI